MDDPVIPTDIVNKARDAADQVADVVHHTLGDNALTALIAVAAVIVILRLLTGVISRVISFVVLAVAIYFLWKFMPQVTSTIGDIFTGKPGSGS